MTVATESCGPTPLRWTGVETSLAPGWAASPLSVVEVYYQPDAVGSVRVLLTLGVHYSVALQDGSGLVTVTPHGIPAAPGTLTLIRNTPAVQETDFANLAKFSPLVHTALHDAAAMRDAEIRRDLVDAIAGDLSTALTASRIANDSLLPGATVADALNAARPFSPLVLVTSGQSNFARFKTLAWSPDVNVVEWNWDHVDTHVGTAFTALDNANITTPRKFASEVARANPDRPVYLIDVSIGGIAIAQWIAGAVAPGMFLNIQNNVTAALAAIGVSKIDALAWWQGNADAGGTGEFNYSDSFETLMNQFKAQSWFPPETPVLVVGLGGAANNLTVGIGYDRFDDTLKFCARHETRKFVDPSTFVGGTFWDNADPPHMLAAGYSAVGALMANEYLRGAKHSVPATAIDAIARHGLQRNGFHTISQINGAAATAFGAGVLLTDGWRGYIQGPAATGQQIASPFATRPDIPSGLKVLVTTAKASLSAGDYFYLSHRIEGHRIQALGFGSGIARPVSIGFWVKSTIAFTGYVTIRNAATDRLFIRRLDLVANTDTWVPLTFPGDFTGTWGAGIGVGLEIMFILGMGSTGSNQTPNNWINAPVAITGFSQTNLGATLSNALTISALTVVPGLYLPSIDHSALIMRPDDEELRLNQRYFYSGVPPMTGTASAAATVTRMSARHPVPMVNVPSVSVGSAVPILQPTVTSTTFSGIDTNYSTADILQLDVNGAAGLSVGLYVTTLQGAGGNLIVNASL